MISYQSLLLSNIVLNETFATYGTARFKLDTRECSTRVCFVTRSKYFCEISRVYNYCTRNCRAYYVTSNVQVTPHEYARYVRNLEDNGTTQKQFKDGKDIYANTLTPLF